MRPWMLPSLNRRRLLELGSVGLAASLGAGRGAGAEELREPGPGGIGGYVLGVFPYLPPSSLDRRFAPIVEALRQRIGQPVHLRTKSDLEAFAVEVARGTYDITFLNPFEYVEAAGAGYLPLVRVDEPLSMVLLVPADSPITDLRGLGGHTLALPQRSSAVSRLAKLALFEEGLQPGVDLQVQFYQSKSSCLQALAIGNVAACGLPRFALPQLGLSDTRSYKVVDERKLPVGLTFAVHNRLSEADRDGIRAALLGLSDTDIGRQILKEASWPRLVLAHDQDFDEIRRLEARMSTLAMRR
jgi:phosphonate transport system substrate-binding protein